MKKILFVLFSLIIIPFLLALIILNNESGIISDNRYLYNGTNIKLFPSALTQVETSVFTHPNDSSVIAATAITDFYAGGYTSGFYKSTNSGLDWAGTDHITDAVGNTIITVGDPSIFICNNGNYVLTYIAPSPVNGADGKVGVRYSINNGTYWSPLVNIPKVDTADKPIAVTDNNISSVYYGRSYIAYGELNFNQTQIKGIYFSYSTNGGVTWDTSRRITNVNPLYKARTVADVSTSSSGDVYVSWLTNKSYIGIAKSTNGGVNWIINDDNAISTSFGRLSYVYNDSIFLQGVPAMDIDQSDGLFNDWLYIVNVQYNLDSLDLMLHRSTNGGNNWSTGTRVNQDSGGFKIQSMPAINVDRYGGINIVYYDTRNSASNDSFDVYLSRSVDGGDNFFDTKISSHNFKLGQPAITLFGFTGYVGSYIGVTSNRDKIIPVWFDNSSGHYQSYTTDIELLPSYRIKIFPEGFYDISTQKLRMKDTAKVYLRNSVSPFAIIDSASSIIDSVYFDADFKFHPNLIPGNYYLEVRHRNSINVWSANPVAYSFGSKVNYDFTLSSGSAYGNNLKSVDGLWCVFSGDVNKDDIIDVSDVVDVYNGAINSLTGYVSEDCTGDSFVDVSDIIVAYNNGLNIVGVITP